MRDGCDDAPTQDLRERVGEDGQAGVASVVAVRAVDAVDRVDEGLGGECQLVSWRRATLGSGLVATCDRRRKTSHRC